MPAENRPNEAPPRDLTPPKPDTAQSAPTVKKRRMDTDASFERRQARREKPFRELSLREMVDEIHDPDIDGDSETDDDAWNSQATRIEYALVKIAEILTQAGIIS